MPAVFQPFFAEWPKAAPESPMPPAMTQLTIPPSIPPPAHSASVVKNEVPICMFPFPTASDTTARTRKYRIPIKSPHKNLRLPIFFPVTSPPKNVPAT